MASLPPPAEGVATGAYGGVPARDVGIIAGAPLPDGLGIDGAIDDIGAPVDERMV